MKDLIKIEPIAVKDKYDVIKALEILEKLGLIIMSEEQKRNYLADVEKNINKNYMIQDDDGFRIQSHYIGNGISLESLEKQVNEIIEISPDICKKIQEIMEKKNKLRKELKILNAEIHTFKNSLPLIILKENII
jgi:hypothetical protein